MGPSQRKTEPDDAKGEWVRSARLDKRRLPMRNFHSTVIASPKPVQHKPSRLRHGFETSSQERHCAKTSLRHWHWPSRAMHFFREQVVHRSSLHVDISVTCNTGQWNYHFGYGTLSHLWSLSFTYGYLDEGVCWISSSFIRRCMVT